MGSDESHFNVSVIVRDKVARRCPETAAFWKECRAEADSNRDPSGYGYFFINTPRLGGLHDIKVSLIMCKNLTMYQEFSNSFARISVPAELNK